MSCGGAEHRHDAHATPAPATEEETSPVAEAAPTAESAAEALAHDLALDGDQKWMMDDHTRMVVGTMSDRFVGRELASSSTHDLEQLGEALSDDIQALIKGCTMSGPAHNELHKFLGHYLPAVNQLTTSGDAVHAARVQALLGVYGDHFE